MSDFQIRCRAPECDRFSSQEYCELHRDGATAESTPPPPHPWGYSTSPMHFLLEGMNWKSLLVYFALMGAFVLAAWLFDTSYVPSSGPTMYRPYPGAEPRPLLDPPIPVGTGNIPKEELERIRESYKPENNTPEAIRRQMNPYDLPSQTDDFGLIETRQEFEKLDEK